MTPEKKEAEKILNDFINILGDDSVGRAYARDCALLCVDKKKQLLESLIHPMNTRMANRRIEHRITSLNNIREELEKL